MRSPDACQDIHRHGLSRRLKSPRPVSGVLGRTEANFAQDTCGDVRQSTGYRAGVSAGLYRHFRLKISNVGNPRWFDPANGRFAVCSVLWQPSETVELEGSFPNKTAMATYNISGTDFQSHDSWSGSRDEPPITAFQQLVDRGCNVANPFDGRDSWMGGQDDFVSVDLGHGGCQPWPGALSLISPFSQWSPGMPPDFTSDASGAAMQPAIDSPAWTNLITVRDWKPNYRSSYQPLGCNWFDRCGVFAHTFQILPAASTVKALEVQAPMDELLRYNVSLDATSDTVFQLHAEKWFSQTSRRCCLNISAVLLTDNGVQLLPSWLSWDQILFRAASGLLTDGYSLRVHAQPGAAAVGNHTVHISAADESQPELLPVSVDVYVSITGIGPTVVGEFPAVEVADGQPLEFALPSDVFKLNKPYGQLSYAAEQQAGVPLPVWLSLAGDGTLSGTPHLGRDSAFNLSITVSDSDGDQNSTFLMLYVRAACPAGLYRHFRLKISPPDKPPRYDRYGWSNAAVCSVAWGILETGQDSFPNATMMASYNISGTTYQPPPYDWIGAKDETPITAFQQLRDAGCDANSYWSDGDSWTPPSVSSAWENLISVQNFKPLPQALGCTNKRCGTYSLTFPILPPSASNGDPVAVSGSDAQRSFSVPVDISTDKLLPLDVDGWFSQSSRRCCFNISAAIIADNSTQPLPPWLSILHKLSRTASGSQLSADYALKVSAQPGREAAGRHTIRILATDQSLPDALPPSVDIELFVIGGPPTIVGSFPTMEVANGQFLDFVLSSNVFQLNKPYGQLAYSAKQRGGMPLPTWLSVDEEGLVRGTPDLATDTNFNLSITAMDRDGAQATTSLTLHVRRACPSGLYRHFRLRLSEKSHPGWYDFVGYKICSVAWETAQPSMDSFPDPAGIAQWNVSGTTSDQPPITAFHQPKCDDSEAWSAHMGDYVAVDFGFTGCRPLPTGLHISSPVNGIAQGGMPTDMTSDASGSALQPASDSDAWVNLVTIRGFRPVTYSGGLFMKDFAIPPPHQPDKPARAIGAIPDVLIQIGMPNDVLLDITGLFTSTARVCCPIISLSIINFLGGADVDSLTAAASTVSPDIPAGFGLPSSFSSLTLSTPSSAIIPFAPLIQPTGSYGSNGLGSYGVSELLSAPSPSPPTTFSEPGPPLNLTSQIPVPDWLSAHFELRDSASGSQQLDIWQYIKLSHEVPVNAVGQYAVAVLAQTPGSNLTSAVLFNLDVVDYYQVRLLLALGGIPPTGLSPFQQTAFQIGISSAFNLSTSQVSLHTPSGQRRMLLQSSGYVLSFTITGLNGRRKALALAKSVEQSVKNGQLDQSLGSSGLSTQVTLASSPQVLKASGDTDQEPLDSGLSGQDVSPVASGSQPSVEAPAPPTFIEPSPAQEGSAPQTPVGAPRPGSIDPQDPADVMPSQPLPPNAAPAATTESVPAVSIPFAVPDLTIASFTDEIKQALLDAITASIPATSNVRVYITNIREGSLFFDTVVLFLDGDSGAAQTLTDTAAASTTVANATAAAPGPSSASPVRSGGFILPRALARATVPSVPVIVQAANPNAVHLPPTSPPPSPPSATTGTPDLQQQVAPVMAPADGPGPSSSYLASPQPSQETVHSGPAHAPLPDPATSGPPLRTDPPTRSSPTPSATNSSVTSPPTNQSSHRPASSTPPPASPVGTVSTSNVASPSTAAEIPLVTFAASLTSFTVATFTAASQSDFKQALISKLSANSAVNVDLLNIRDGSLLLNVALTFLNGDVASANTLTSLLSTSNGIQSIFDPNGPFGAIDITDIKQGYTANPHAASKQLNPGQIAGIAIGCAAAAGLLVFIVTAAIMMRRHKQRDHEHVALASGPPADPSAQPQASNSPTAFRRGHQVQPAP
ncbi:hypothetical protein WJX74_005202 [Apatococcus lobatus]|uniref:Dystroglycan-type cadherin-like domain-containing protein n=1 Tax=Apatococcus lobatus TaxID=904363 RepID=A0AAW1QTV7_9CHLO